MFRIVRALAATALALAVGFAVAAPAEAGAIYPGAGYKVTGIAKATTTFVVPRVDCAGAGSDGLVQFGMFATDISWRAVVSVACLPQPQYSLDILTDNGGVGFGGDQVARPGHSIEVTLVSTSTRSTFRVVDETVHKPIELAQPRVSTVLAVGAYSERTIPAFDSPVMGFTANGGKRLAQLDYVRHVQIRNGVRQIGTGMPWKDGVHFRLYYKHH